MLTKKECVKSATYIARITNSAITVIPATVVVRVAIGVIAVTQDIRLMTVVGRADVASVVVRAPRRIMIATLVAEGSRLTTTASIAEIVLSVALVSVTVQASILTR